MRGMAAEVDGLCAIKPLHRKPWGFTDNEDAFKVND